ncbi:MAG: 3-oxoacyl-ACP synthase [Cupriavidus sp.]|nr:MAG: 3-oxoacyl-ACP synthase [Cupriavidus sp.]
MQVQIHKPRCFGAAQPTATASVESALPAEASHALAALLPILGCGEEAAGLAFAGLACAASSDPVAALALQRIACEEEVHDGLIHALAAALPAPPDQTALLGRTRRFHLELGRGEPVVRLARIVALDSAVCLILSRLLRPGNPIARDEAAARILRRIARDEAGHVRATRKLAAARGDEALLRRAGAPVRERLAELLMEAADVFEALSFDPAWLRRDVGELPHGLYRS